MYDDDDDVHDDYCIDNNRERHKMPPRRDVIRKRTVGEILIELFSNAALCSERC